MSAALSSTTSSEETMPQPRSGWYFDVYGAVTYLEDEPFMTASEYHSYRKMWILAFGDHDDLCERQVCSLCRIQPPQEQPASVRHV